MHRMSTYIDHLVVVADNLTQGEQWVRQTFGATPAPGGKHLSMGTHNLLLRVGAALYLEVIAIDPAQSAPVRARWFNMDRPDMQAAVKRAPRLAHFVARSNNLAATMKKALHAPGEILELARDNFHWSITVPADGALIEYGLVPSLIQWDSVAPTDVLPDSGVYLTRLIAKHPDAARLRALHRAIGLQGAAIEEGAQAELIAAFNTSSGEVRLTSRLTA
jgi:predicted RNA-binding protein YlxR (DUF448 family)